MLSSKSEFILETTMMGVDEQLREAANQALLELKKHGEVDNGWQVNLVNWESHEHEVATNDLTWDCTFSFYKGANDEHFTQFTIPLRPGSNLKSDAIEEIKKRFRLQNNLPNERRESDENSNS
ncbi:MAG: hypothetical protein ACJ741_00465 [Pyrinomonadaceae bacterium]